MDKCNAYSESWGYLMRSGAEACRLEKETETKKPHFISEGYWGVLPAPEKVYFVRDCDKPEKRGQVLIIFRFDLM